MSKSIIHFAGDDYWISNPHSRYHISKAFWKKGYKILWINQVGFHFPSVRKSGSGALKKIFRKLKSYAKALKKVDDGFYVYTPIMIPKFKEGKTQKLNDLLMKFQIRILQTILNIHNPILFFSTPLYGKAIDFIKHINSFYYYSDKYTEARVLDDEGRKLISNLDKLLYTKSDQLFCASKLLTDFVSEKAGREAHYLPHGVDVDFFMDEKNKFAIEEMEKIKKPICGYFGTLTVSNDWELIKYCAENRPEYNFVFVGRKEVALPELVKLTNVFFLGKKNYSEIPAYGNYFDVCLNFWVMKDWIKNSSPLKIKEYLALGKPVVSTVIEEIKKNFNDVVYLSGNKEEFLVNLDKALQEDNSGKIKIGVERVKKESWIKAADEIEELTKIEIR